MEGCRFLFAHHRAVCLPSKSLFSGAFLWNLVAQRLPCMTVIISLHWALLPLRPHSFILLSHQDHLLREKIAVVMRKSSCLRREKGSEKNERERGREKRVRERGEKRTRERERESG